MDERLKFIGRLLEGEKMAPLCREFGISRVTGYKIYNRYKECGLDGLYDRSRAPYRQANRLPYQVERTILGIKKKHPSWGAPKIRDKLIRQYPMIPTPAASTIHAALDRNGLVKRRKRKRYKARGTTLIGADQPNGLWCADYKGEFMLGNRQYCYPLTISDYRSRYLLACEGLEYPYHDRTVRVTRCGRICIGGRKINFSVVFASQLVGLREVDDLNHQGRGSNLCWLNLSQKKLRSPAPVGLHFFQGHQASFLSAE